MLLDAVINCFTVVIDGRHLMIDGNEVRMNYVRRWLAIDIIAIFPYWLLIPSPPLLEVSLWALLMCAAATITLHFSVNCFK